MQSATIWPVSQIQLILSTNTSLLYSNIPNEYIRGATLRFLQKISRDVELLEPLIPTCRSCLEHRHSYVRKNAVFAVYSIHREFEHLIPDAPELMHTFLIAETDSTCKRDAFVFLVHCSMQKAVEYVLSIYDSIPSLEEALQMSIVEVIRLDCKSDSAHRVRGTSLSLLRPYLSAFNAGTLDSLYPGIAECVISCG